MALHSAEQEVPSKKRLAKKALSKEYLVENAPKLVLGGEQGSIITQLQNN